MKSVAEIFRSYGVLDNQGRHVNGTDKETNHHYGDAYEKILTISRPSDDPGNVVRSYYPRSIREDVQLMMEIGIADGSSLLAWREIFPNALCVGLDIMPADKALREHGNRIEFCRGDQRSRADCERAANNRLFDVIVEDATHKLEDTLLTLYHLWPYVKPGGLYIVEEWEGCAGDRDRIKSLWPNVEIVGTCGPHIQDEPLIVFRKPVDA